MPPAGFEPTVPESKRSHTHALDRAAAAISKQLLAKNITCLIYVTIDFISNFSGSFHWNQASSQGRESGAVHQLGISKMSKKTWCSAAKIRATLYSIHVLPMLNRCL
jgi:hypothetical protein